MRYASVEDKRIEPEYSGQKASCPFCGSAVVARCGDILVDHWAHVDKSNCIGCSTPMTDWHRSWQDEFPIECQEKKIGNHRADVLIDGFVIEVQHSRLPGPEIKAREDAYKKLIWIIDVTESDPSFSFGRWQCFTSNLDRYCLLCKSPLFLDMGTKGVCQVFEFEKRGNSPSGTGVLFSRKELSALLKDPDWKHSLKPTRSQSPRKMAMRQAADGKGNWRDGEEGTTCGKSLESIASHTGNVKPVMRAKISCGCVFREDYIEEADPNRYGWIRTNCRACGKWIGSRPENLRK